MDLLVCVEELLVASGLYAKRTVLNADMINLSSCNDAECARRYAARYCVLIILDSCSRNSALS